MARTLDILKLVEQPDMARDQSWEEAFLHALAQCRLNIDNEEACSGPDGWPYLLVSTGPDAKEPTSKIAQWLSTRGIGLVVNANKKYPDYVLSYGMVWNFVHRGEFLTATEQSRISGQVVYQTGEKVLAGPPTEDYLPLYVRSVLSEFFGQQGIKELRVLLLSKDQKNYDLCFSKECLGNPAESELAGIAEAIAWFLPQHYSVVIASEQGLPEFGPLMIEQAD